MTPDVDAWDAWHPRTVADRLAGVSVPWYVAGGWALDLFRGAQTREHEDLEIAVPERAFAAVAARFPDCDFYVPGGGRVVPLAPGPMREHHQTWALDRAALAWRFDVFREPHDGDIWICRRDPSIRRSYAAIVRRTDDGVPYLTPEIVLLFKAKAGRDKDLADLEGTLPLLTTAQRTWLDEVLGVVHPDHGWRARLRA